MLAGFIQRQQQAGALGPIVSFEALEGSVVVVVVVGGVVNAFATEEQTLALFHSSIFIEPI